MSAWTARVQDIGLYTTALALFMAPAGVSIGLGLLWLGFFLSLFAGRSQPASGAVWLTLAFGVYVVLDGLVVAAPVSPGQGVVGPSARLESAADWAQLCVLVPVAYALRGDQRRLLQVLALALVGLLLGVAWRLDWRLLLFDPGAYALSRPGFGFPTIVFALFSGAALLGLFTLRQRWWDGRDGERSRGRVLLWLLTTAAVAQSFILTLSRGASIALAATLLIGAGIRRRRGQAEAAARRRRLPTLAAGAALALGLLLLNAGPIVDRLSQEWGDVGAMLSGDIDYAQTSSLSQRWHAQRFGIAVWSERPWLGWGPGTTKALIAGSGKPALTMPDGQPLVHLHNTYLEILVQLGLAGLLLWLALLLSLMTSVRAGVHARLLSPDVAGFLFLAVLYLALWSLFDFHAVHQGWRGFWALLAGSALSFGLCGRVR